MPMPTPTPVDAELAETSVNGVDAETKVVSGAMDTLLSGTGDRFSVMTSLMPRNPQIGWPKS